MRVVGVDGCKDSWVAVVLEDGRFHTARLFQSVEQVLSAYPGAAVVGIDIPIGYPVRGSRLADAQARSVLGPIRGRSVFEVLPPALLALATYDEARRKLAAGGSPGISKQSWALKEKIQHVARIARADVRLHEVHPELSFWAMRGERAVLESKRTWTGFWIRLRLLEEQGIRIPDDIENGELCGIDDVLDAAAVAWSAQRIAQGKAAGCFPPRGQEQFDEHGRAVAIWY